MTAHAACPCLHATPCDPRCTCVVPASSTGCRRCCSYGSREHQRARAETLAALIDAGGQRSGQELDQAQPTVHAATGHKGN